MKLILVFSISIYFTGIAALANGPITNETKFLSGVVSKLLVQEEQLDEKPLLSERGRRQTFIKAASRLDVVMTVEGLIISSNNKTAAIFIFHGLSETDQVKIKKNLESVFENILYETVHPMFFTQDQTSRAEESMGLNTSEAKLSRAKERQSEFENSLIEEYQPKVIAAKPVEEDKKFLSEVIRGLSIQEEHLAEKSVITRDQRQSDFWKEAPKLDTVMTKEGLIVSKINEAAVTAVFQTLKGKDRIQFQKNLHDIFRSTLYETINPMLFTQDQISRAEESMDLSSSAAKLRKAKERQKQFEYELIEKYGAIFNCSNLMDGLSELGI